MSNKKKKILIIKVILSIVLTMIGMIFVLKIIYVEYDRNSRVEVTTVDQFHGRNHLL